MADISLARTWVRMMEAEMAEGKSVAQAAERTVETFVLQNSLIGGARSYAFFKVLSELEEMWEYGPELRRWHSATRGV